MINYSILEAYEGKVGEELVIVTAQAALKQQGIDPDTVDLSIVIEDNAALKKLNNQYLGIDSPTDVLSFALQEKDPETGRMYLGDVIISLEKALEQSDNAGHSLDAELQLLTVHGILHLLGHDHAEDSEKAKMWSAQHEILDELKVELKKWPEE